jgi:hypothetical protein
MLNSDFVNIAICGTSNLRILSEVFYKFINQLSKQYDKIEVVVTLTESFRELFSNPPVDFQLQYNIIKGVDWPDYNAIISTEIDENILNFILNDVVNSHDSKLDILVHQSLLENHNISTLLKKYEEYTFTIINQLFESISYPNIDYTIGRNFTHSFGENRKILKERLLEKSWVEIIADKGNLAPYPENVYIFSAIGTTPLLKYTDHHKVKTKDLVNILDSIKKSTHWLDESPFNYKTATRHPNEQAHYWWAEYIFQEISKGIKKQ